MPEKERRDEPSKTGSKGGETRREEGQRGGESHGGKGDKEHRR